MLTWEFWTHIYTHIYIDFLYLNACCQNRCERSIREEPPYLHTRHGNLSTSQFKTVGFFFFFFSSMVPEALIATCHSLSLPFTDRPGLTVRSLKINEICNDRETEKDLGERGRTGGSGCKVHWYKSTVLWWKGFFSVLLLHSSPCPRKIKIAKLGKLNEK